MGKIVPANSLSKDQFAIILRTAIKSDAKKMNDLATDIFLTSEYMITVPEEFSVWSVELQEERIQRYENDENSLLLVVEQSDQLIGMLDFQAHKKKRIAHRGVFGMSVRSTWRGKGVGNALLNGLIDWVKTHSSIEVINLTVIENNQIGLNLYQKMGFEVTGREPFGLKLKDDEYLADLTMSLRVPKQF